MSNTHKHIPLFSLLTSLILYSCDMPIPTEATSYTVKTRESHSIQETLASSKNGIGPRSTGEGASPNIPGSYESESLLDYFKTLNAQNYTAEENPITTRLKFPETFVPAPGTTELKTREFAVQATFNNGEKQNLLTAQISEKGDYTYSSEDITSIKNHIQVYETQIIRLDFVFFTDADSTKTAIRIEPHITERNIDLVIANEMIPKLVKCSNPEGQPDLNVCTEY